MPSPVGRLKLVASDAGLAGVLWADSMPSPAPNLPAAAQDADHPLCRETRRQLDSYFAGTRRTFDIPLDFIGGDFSKRVWSALLNIPYGETRTYGQIARQIGAPGAVRAVGTANGRNPVAIIAPCHRVIGANGRLTGFAGGLAAKAWLLNLEAGDLFRPRDAA